MADGEGVRVEGFRKTLFARAPFYVAGRAFLALKNANFA